MELTLKFLVNQGVWLNLKYGGGARGVLRTVDRSLQEVHINTRELQVELIQEISRNGGTMVSSRPFYEGRSEQLRGLSSICSRPNVDLLTSYGGLMCAKPNKLNKVRFLYLGKF